MAIEPLTEEQAAEGLRRLGEEKAEEQALDLARGKKLVERYDGVIRKLLEHEQRRQVLSTQIGIHNDLAHAGEVGTMSPDDIRKAADELEAILNAMAGLRKERDELEAQLPDADSPGYGALLAQAPDLSKATGAWLNQPGGDATIEDRLEAYGFDPGDEADPKFRPRTQAVNMVAGRQGAGYKEIRGEEPPTGEPKAADRPEPIPGRTREEIDANERAARVALDGPVKSLAPEVGVPDRVVRSIRDLGAYLQGDLEAAEFRVQQFASLRSEVERLTYESEARRQSLCEAIDEVRILRAALEEWQKVSDLDKCEGCERPADTEDVEGVPLCLGCAGVEPDEARKPQEFTGQVGQG